MTKEKRLQTIDGESLMNLPLQPLRFVVDSLLSQGLHILAGSPKVGKSWLALWLSVAVAKGEPVWGMETQRGTTLYLCLEDSTLRIQNRLFEIAEDAPSSVHFTTHSELLGKGLEEQLGCFLTEHPDTVLIIIDAFIEKAKQYKTIDALTPEMLRLFIRRIEVGERSVKYSRHSEQKIRIIYRDIGDADSAMWEEEAKPRILPPISESICQTA